MPKIAMGMKLTWNPSIWVKGTPTHSRKVRLFIIWLGIKDNSDVRHIDISRNNLEDDGCLKILESISNQIETIDLSSNVKLSSVSYQRLGFLIDDPYKK